jgi:Ca2+-binding EF-hand superfamily protein
MKTIPVCLIVASLLVPAVATAQAPAGPPPPPPDRGDDADRPPQRPPREGWRAADKDGDGFISRVEFDAMPRPRKLPDDKRERLFGRLDKDADGKLSRDELGRMHRPHDGPPPPMRRLWELDVDKSGGVSFEEFKQGPFFKKLPDERQAAIFRRLDSDGDGMITPKDKPPPPPHKEGPHPRRPDGMGKPKRPPLDPLRMIRQLDEDGDGALSFEEFRAGPAVSKLGEDEQEDRFEAMDRNKDRKLTLEDFPPPPPHDGPPHDGPPPDMQDE